MKKGWSAARGDQDRVAVAVLAAAAVVAASLLLYLGRGTTYSFDELPWVIESPDLTLSEVLRPHNGHLILIPRLLYKAVLEVFGSDYLAFRLLATSSVILIATLVFVYSRRRIGALAALAPSLVLLVFGSDLVHVLVGNAITVLFALSCGVAALIALDQCTRKGDVAACLLLCLGTATYTVALAFVAGVGIYALSSPQRRSRFWIAAIPLGLYAVWWLWSLGYPSGSEGQLTYSNLLLLPAWALQMLGAALASLTGLGYSFTGTAAKGQLGLTFAVLGALTIGWRLRRPPTPGLVMAIGIALTLSGIEVLAHTPFTGPETSRYMFPAAVAVIIVAVEAGSDIAWTGSPLAALGVVALVGVASNLALLRDGSQELRDAYAPQLRANLTGLELAGPGLDPAFDPSSVLGGQNQLVFPFAEAKVFRDSPSRAYVAAAADYGDLGLSRSELAASDESVRGQVDATLAEAVNLELAPLPAGTRADCAPQRLKPGGGGKFRLPPRGALIAAEKGGASVLAQRFATSSWVEIGTAGPSSRSVLAARPDLVGRPWTIEVQPPTVRICALP